MSDPTQHADRAALDQQWADARDWMLHESERNGEWLDSFGANFDREDTDWMDTLDAHGREVLAKLAALALRETAMRISED